MDDIMSRRIFIALLALTALGLPASAERYIVPMWASLLEGRDGTWWTQATAINPNAFPVTVQVTSVYPLQTDDCPGCTGAGAPFTIAPHGQRTIHPPSGQPGRGLVAGAFELETSAPVHIHLVAYKPGAKEIRQRLDVARSWLRPGTRMVSSVERAGEWRMNVFIVNPEDRDLTASVWAGNRAENEVRAVIAAGATGMVALPSPRCNGAPCPWTTEYPPRPATVHVEADGVFLASVSSIGNGWAVFSLADEAFVIPPD